ncbi:hypothetical protein [Micromonospora sp. CB01531]|uniref:hypothetical protein n=1 Tax=Micromonospora sp. CB01531 TaxID=1718947 RepID=UPI00093BE506|nr:hypothetical protein [Micromonospora sp. CB01531]OKI45730.1 hypothetical protein A6A27_37965 [Micromonospora sp. CB01531]
MAPLVLAQGRYERSDEPQFRPPAKPEVLAERQVPEVLRADLLQIGGDQVAQLPPKRLLALAQRLTEAEPDPAGRAETLLNWLGRLPYPTEALWGEGVLVRRLLDTVLRAAILAAAASARPAATLGALNWAVHQDDDTPVAAVIAPAVRQLLQ